MAGSSSQTNTNVTFDLSSQVGVLQALYAVRTSELSSSKKNELRDDIFTYTKSGGDTRMREQLEAQLKQVPLSKEFLTKKATTKPQKESSETGLNTGRQAPQFSVPSTPSSFTPQSVQDEQTAPKVKQAAPQPNSEQPTQPVTSNEAGPAATNIPASAAPQPQQPEPTPAPVPAADNQRVNQSPQMSQPTQPTQPSEPSQPTQVKQTSQRAVVSEPALTPAPVEATASQPAQTNIDTSINRIRKIKRAVNNAVGNPVNLVDIDNTLGRQYMSALLKAMQSVNAETGAAGPTEMQELENAYQAITPILNREANTSQAEEASKQPVEAPASPEPKVQADQSVPGVEQSSTPVPAPKSTKEELSQNQPASAKSPTTPPSESAPVAKCEVPITSGSQPDDSKVATDGAVEAKSKPNQNYAEPNSQPTTPPANYQVENKIPVSVESSTEQKIPAEKPVSRERETESTTEPKIATAPSKATAAPADNVPLKSETQTTPTSTPNQRKDSGSFKILPITQEEEGPKADYGFTHKTAIRKTPASEDPPTTSTAEKAPTTSSSASQTISDAPVSKKESAPEPKNQPEQKPPVPPKENFQPTPSLKQQTEGETIDAKLDTLKKQNQSQQAKIDPLFSPEIDAGLEQLLQEWSIFKSSGLFGTGPNGREHPLFKKIAPLMVQDVAVGRFEDARPEVVQSISDYMNGWRYEQGIVYQAGETFETYLRRVIKFILTGKP